jgi:hypothetical protein
MFLVNKALRACQKPTWRAESGEANRGCLAYKEDEDDLAIGYHDMSDRELSEGEESSDEISDYEMGDGKEDDFQVSH